MRAHLALKQTIPFCISHFVRMTEIRVNSPSMEDEEVQQLISPGLTSNSTSIQLQGLVADSSGVPVNSRSPSNSVGPHYTSERPSRNNYAEVDRRERAGSMLSMPASLKSEPDLDTIMPLPGSYMPGKAASGGGEMHQRHDSEESYDGRESTPSFTTVEHYALFGDDLTAKALQTCKKTVLNPHLVFLKMIGWRRFNPKRYDLRSPTWLVALNIMWPTFVCLLLVASCVTQICTCFRRDSVSLTLRRNLSDNESHYELSCEDHIFTIFILPDILLILSFAYGMYIFRWVHTEQLATLTEAVFLGHMSKHGKYSHKRLTRTLQLLMLLGLAWITYSLATSIGRAYTLHLVDNNTDFRWIAGRTRRSHGFLLGSALYFSIIGYLQLLLDQGSFHLCTKRKLCSTPTPWADRLVRYVFISVTVVGFVLLDIAYTAVVVNYCIQCQLLVYLLCSISERTRIKEWGLDKAIKEIRNSREFLSQLNSHLSRAMSLLIFIFLTSSINVIYGLHQVKSDNTTAHLVSLFGVLAALQWLSILILPLIQAARVTRACSSLKKTATEIRSRPYSYKDTSQLDLDSVIVFTSGLNMSAKLVSLPISPGLVAGIFFASGLALFLIFQYETYSWAKWL